MQRAQRVAHVFRDSLQIPGASPPSISHDRRTEIGLARKVMVDARSFFSAHVGGKIAEIQAVIAVSLRNPRRRSQNRLEFSPVCTFIPVA